MPIYEFKCKDNHVFEIVCSWQDSQKDWLCPVEFADETTCNKECVKLPALPTMKPDKNWHFEIYNGALDKTFKNEKEQNAYYKANKLEVVKKGEIPVVTGEDRVRRNADKLDGIREEKIGKILSEYVF